MPAERRTEGSSPLCPGVAWVVWGSPRGAGGALVGRGEPGEALRIRPGLSILGSPRPPGAIVTKFYCPAAGFRPLKRSGTTAGARERKTDNDGSLHAISPLGFPT